MSIKVEKRDAVVASNLYFLALLKSNFVANFRGLLFFLSHFF